MKGTFSRARLAVEAAALLCVLVVPIAVAGAAGEPGGPTASESASVKKKVKKLKQQVTGLQEQTTGLQEQVATLEGEQGEPRPPSGPAGGELNSSYPNPHVDQELGFTELSIDGPCPGGHTGTCPGQWDSDALTLTRKDGSPTEITYNAFYNGEALGFSGSNGDGVFLSGTGFLQMREASFQNNPPSNAVNVYPRSAGAGLTELVARFDDGTIVELAQELP